MVNSRGPAAPVEPGNTNRRGMNKVFIVCNGCYLEDNTPIIKEELMEIYGVVSSFGATLDE